jgi:hypothetical protein
MISGTLTCTSYSQLPASAATTAAAAATHGLRERTLYQSATDEEN